MRIVVVSNVRCLREALQAGLAGSGFQGQADVLSLAAMRSTVFTLPPHFVLVAASALEGIACMTGLRTVSPTTNVAVLALEDRDEDFFAWARFGICGYIEADATLASIVSTFLRIVAGEIVYPKRLSGALLNQFARQTGRTQHQDAFRQLTRRELAVLELLADGLSNKAIAGCLSIADATVKNHVHSLLEKMAVHSRGEAAACYRRLPILGRHWGGGPVAAPLARESRADRSVQPADGVA